MDRWLNVPRGPKAHIAAPFAGSRLLERMGLENLLLVVCHWNAGAFFTHLGAIGRECPGVPLDETTSWLVYRGHSFIPCWAPARKRRVQICQEPLDATR